MNENDQHPGRAAQEPTGAPAPAPGGPAPGGALPGLPGSGAPPGPAFTLEPRAGRIGNPLLQLTLARARSFFREPAAIFWTFGFPMVLALALGVAFRSRPAEQIPVAVVTDVGPRSPALDGLSRHAGLKISWLKATEAESALRRGRVALVVRPLLLAAPVIPGAPSFDYVLDPARPDSRLARLIVDEGLQRGGGRIEAVISREVPVTARGSRYIDFLIPGLLGLSLMQSGLWGIGFILVDYRNRKLIKLMIATPMKKSDFLLGFVVLRAGFLLLELPVLLGFAYLAFDVRPQGSVLLVFALCALGALTFCGMGLLVASRAQNTQTVTGLINVVTIPMFIGSGVFFSADRFPEELQPTLQALPLTALNDALRAVINEGAGVTEVGRHALVLALWGVVAFLAALKLFRWK